MKRILLPLWAAALLASAPVRADEPALTATLLEKLGTWDGKAEAAALEGPYEDPLQQEIPFGRRSYYLSPWRAYMDTWPAAHFRQVLGINFNVNDREAEPVAQVLETAGISSARVEVGWGGFSYQDPTKLSDDGTRLTALLQALKRHDIRPLILLNANSGQPVPQTLLRGKLRQEAVAGAREVFFDGTDGIRPGYTGFRGLVSRRQGFPFIVSLDAATGRAELSAPLPKALPAGPVELVTLKYKPLGGEVLQDGTPNPAARETLEGWLTYVAAVSRYAKAALGTEGAADAGFDIEVWNEYSFGSEFLNDKNYYEPALVYKEPLTYETHGRRQTGPEVLLAVTVDYFNDPENAAPGVNVISGFSNQRPWDNGTDMWPGQAGFSRHYYTGIDVPGKYMASPANEKSNSGPVNALGLPDGTPDGKDWHTVVPGSFFVPTLTVQGPETWHFGYKTEFITRDVQPFPGPMKGHFRYAHPGTGRPATVWQTEVNTYRAPWAQWLREQTGVTREDERYHHLMQHLSAKTLLRTYVFMSAKGLGPQQVYAAKEVDDSFGSISEAFFKALAANKYVLTPEIQALAGPGIEAVRRVAQLLGAGQPMVEARPLQVEKLVEHRPRLVFAGDGTTAHPDRFNRDDFACMPYQLDAGRYAIGYYVVTRNLVQEWDKTKDRLEGARYDMPDQDFDVTLGNLCGQGATVSVLDPMSGATLPARILNASPTTLTVRLPTSDVPRFLLVEEAKPGPLVMEPKLKMTGATGELSFKTNLKLPVRVTWGGQPERTSGGAADLPAGTEHKLTIPRLAAEEGVKITCQSDGLMAVWPRWGYDVAGIGSFALRRQRDDPPATATLRLPILPEQGRPSAYTVQLPPGLQWSGTGTKSLWVGEPGQGIEISLQTSALEGPALLNLLPEVSTLDRAVVNRKDWNGVPAWEVHLTLDPAAHPGVTELNQIYRIAPLRTGSLVLAYKGGSLGFRGKNLETARGIVEGVKFSP